MPLRKRVAHMPSKAAFFVPEVQSASIRGRFYKRKCLNAMLSKQR